MARFEKRGREARLEERVFQGLKKKEVRLDGQKKGPALSFACSWNVAPARDCFKVNS